MALRVKPSSKTLKKGSQREHPSANGNSNFSSVCAQADGEA